MKPADLLIPMAIGAGAIWLYNNRKDKPTGAIPFLPDSVDPTSDRNAAYKGVNAAGAAITGNKDFSLGVWLYEILNPGKVRAEAQVTALSPTPPAPVSQKKPAVVVATKPAASTHAATRQQAYNAKMKSEGWTLTYLRGSPYQWAKGSYRLPYAAPL